MEDLVFFVGIIGNIVSVLLFLSPVKTFTRIVKNRSTEEFESLPYICTLMNSSLWTYYGTTKPGSYLVATVNGFGVVAEIVYILLFIFFAHPRERGRTTIMCGIMNVGLFGAALLVTYVLLHGDMRINAIGLMSSAFNIIMYASPLAAMKSVVRSKSVKYMPFLLSFCFFLNGGVWTLYAVLQQDWFLGVPNGLGFALGTLQLGLYAIYSNYKPLSKLQRTDFDETSHNEPLLEEPQ